MIHLSNNQVQDPFTSVKYPHWFFSMKFEKEMLESPLPYNSQYPAVDWEVQFVKTCIERNQVNKVYDFDQILFKIYPNHYQHTLLIKSITGFLKVVLTDKDFKSANVP